MARSRGHRRGLRTVGGGRGTTLVAVVSGLTMLLAACSQAVDTQGSVAGSAATLALANASETAATTTVPAEPSTTAAVATKSVSSMEPTAGGMTPGTVGSRPAARTTGDGSAGTVPAAGTSSSATATGSGSATRAAGAGTTTFDPHTVNWESISLPPHACAGWSESAPKNLDYPFVHLSDGKAFIADPDGTTVPGIGPAGWYLSEAGKPQYGQLAGGAPVVVMLLTCAPAGGNMITESIVVFDGSQRGAPYLAIYRPPGGVADGGIRFRDGAIAIDYSTLEAGDARCCPSGKGTTTIGLQGGVLIANWPNAVLAQRAQVVRPGAPAGPGATATGATATTMAGGPAGRALLPGGGRIVTLTAASGNTYIGTILAEDHITDCTGNATNSAVKAFLAQHPCPHGVYRRLIAIPLHGRTVALSVIQIAAPIGPDTDAHLYDLVSPLARAMRAGGTGGFIDLLAAGNRPADWPVAIPAVATYGQYGEDLGIQAFRAWYLTGPNSSGDAGLTAMEQDLFLSRITTMGG